MECFRKNLPYYRRKFLRVNYIDITENTFIRNINLKEIMAREVLRNESCYTFIAHQVDIKIRWNL
jgi:hypothetical protein